MSFKRTRRIYTMNVEEKIKGTKISIFNELKKKIPKPESSVILKSKCGTN